MTYADISLPMTGSVLGVAQTFKKSDFHARTIILKPSWHCRLS
jgi:hypothetical protein